MHSRLLYAFHAHMEGISRGFKLVKAPSVSRCTFSENRPQEVRQSDDPDSFGSKTRTPAFSHVCENSISQDMIEKDHRTTRKEVPRRKKRKTYVPQRGTR